ncbi:hypothetical protein BC937DRAFT_89117, partial [Endogone sp. FLAS-F59071]
KPIPEFPLAEHDIVSVFALPTTVFGRSHEIELISSVIRRVANANALVSKSHTSNFLDDMCLGGSVNISDDVSDTSGESGSITGDKPLNVPMSGTSAHGGSSGSSEFHGVPRRRKQKQLTEIITIHGSGGVGLHLLLGMWDFSHFDEVPFCHELKSVNPITGKSTLVRSVQNEARDCGYLATAKFDNRQQIPYGCILQCISLILKQLLTESEVEIAHFHKILRNSLGAQLVNVRLIIDIVPELKPIFSNMSFEQIPEVEQLNSAENRARFHSIFVEVIRIIASWRMLTFFLDDVHQAVPILSLSTLHFILDEPSLDLVTSLIRANIPLLIILSYRDNELPPKLVSILGSEHALVTNIQLRNLDYDALHGLVASALQRKVDEDCADITPLVELLAQKCKGNAFYTTQILLALERKKLIFFDWKASRWEYNLQGIADLIESGSTESDDKMDLDFLVQRLKELPLDSQKFLKWASFIGNVFSWEAVRYLMTHADSSDSSDTDGEDDQRSPTSPMSPRSPRAFDFIPNFNVKPPSSTGTTNGKKRKRLRGKDAVNGLEVAMREGIILPGGLTCGLLLWGSGWDDDMDEDNFKFTHDRFSRAAMMLADSMFTEKIHLSIAEMLMNNSTADVFLAADHLMKASELVSSLSKISPYRDVLIKAGDKASVAGAHAMALSYYKFALKLTNEASWLDDFDSSYEKTLHLYLKAAELNWVAGNVDSTEALLKKIFQHSRTPLDRAGAYQIQQRLFFLEKKHTNGSDALFNCLRELGVTGVKSDLTQEELNEAYEEAKQEVLRIGFDNIANLGPCKDKTLKTIMDVLEDACTAAYWLAQLPLMFFVSAKLVSASLKFGMTNVSGIGFVFFGIAAVEGYRQFEFGQEMGKFGVTIGEKYGRQYDRGRGRFLYTCFLAQWKHHIRETIPMYKQIYTLSLSAGDRIYASFARLHFVISMFHSGEHLSQVLEEAQSCFNEVHSWSSSADTNILIVSLIRTVLALQGNTYLTEQGIFDDETFCDADFVLENSNASTNPTVPMNWYLSYKMLPLVLYGYNNAAIDLGMECLSTIHCHPLHTRMMLYLYSLAMIAVIRDGDISDDIRQQYLDQIHENQQLIYEWVLHSGNNMKMWYTLVEAELASLSSDVRKTDSLYEEAINQARTGRWQLEMGIILEHAGEYYLRSDLRNIAMSLLSRSVSAYTEVGAYGKVRQLQDKHDTLLCQIDNQVPTMSVGCQTDAHPTLNQHFPWDESINSTSNSSITGIVPTSTEQTLMALDIVDLASILKSSQVISSEVDFESLIQSMMGITLENSGAEAGAIIVKSDEAYCIVGYGTQKDGSTSFDPPKQLSDDDDLLSARIVLYTLHTRETVFITNVRTDHRFSTGAWFVRAGATSVICTPICHKNTMVGCLYLEGSVGSFTPKHLRVMTLLCQQIGISVTNALLFSENSEMIESQNMALQEAKESREAALKATRLKSTFLANMSHELRTPFSGFHGMISLLSETELNVEQRDFVETAKQSCDQLLQIIDDLLNFSKLEAGKVVLDLSSVYMEDLIADVIELLTILATRKGLNMTYIVDDAVPSILVGDSNRIKQILNNLIGNAIKFTHQGEIIVRCSLDRSTDTSSDSKSVKLRFEVTDSGIGISAEQQKHLFEPFSQVDSSSTRNYGGTGLGLSICLQLVKLMNGSVGVISEQGRGSTFWFTAEFSKAVFDADVASHQELPHAHEIAFLTQRLGSPRVLIGANHPSTLDMLGQFLGFTQPEKAFSLDEAINALQNSKFDVVVLDFPLDEDVTEELLAIQHNPRLHNLHIILLQKPSLEEMRLKDNADAGTTKLRSDNPGAKISKISKPARRLKILRSMAQILNRPMTSKSRLGFNKNGSAKDMLTKEEQVSFKGLPILIAEDNPIAQKVLHKQLSNLDFSVDCANNGLEALEKWSSKPPGYYRMAFFDHHMPKCDGVEAATRLRRLEQEINAATSLSIVGLSGVGKGIVP